MGSLQFTLVCISDSEDGGLGERNHDKDDFHLSKKMKNTKEYRGDHFSSHRAKMRNQQSAQIFLSDGEAEGVEERKAEEDVSQLKRASMKNTEYKATVGNQWFTIISTSESEDERVREGATDEDDSPLQQNKMENTEDCRGGLSSCHTTTMCNQPTVSIYTSDSEGEAVGERKAEDDEPQLKKKVKSTEEHKGDPFSANRATKRNRRFTVVSTSDSDDESLEERRVRRLKKMNNIKKTGEDKAVQKEVKPIGKVIKVSGKGLGKRNHYKAFEYDGYRYQLEDAVVVVPEDMRQKAKFAIVKDITQDIDENMMVISQRLYFPYEAEKRGGGSWEARDMRELFYSFHRDEDPANHVMHNFNVHFVPLQNGLPACSLHQGFIVQRVYDHVEKKLWSLTDNDYEDDKQHEIDLFVQKTREHLRTIETKEATSPKLNYHQLKNKPRLRRNLYMSRSNVARASYDTTTKIDHQHVTAKSNPGSCTGNISEFYAILAQFGALKGETPRDRSLEKLLEGIQSVRDYSKDGKQVECFENVNELSSPESCGTRFQYWPDAAVSAVVALEQSLHDLGYDLKKYNQKMRQLIYNLSNNEQLARRFVKQELEAKIILNMSADELRNGRLMMEETATRNEPAEQPAHIQRTDYRCSRCQEKKVVLKDIIQAGRGERYQYECNECGKTWVDSSR